MEALFPGVDTDSMFLVPTCQHSKMDLVRTGDDVEKEKDYCLEKVRNRWSMFTTSRGWVGDMRAVCGALRAYSRIPFHRLPDLEPKPAPPLFSNFWNASFSHSRRQSAHRYRRKSTGVTISTRALDCRYVT